MRKYPIGIQTYSEIIRKGFVYVDKTDLVWQLTNYAKYIFLSRPRRFGKSLLTTTLASYFQGEKELFEGLKIMELEQKWEQYPVIRLDISTAKGQDSTEALRDKLNLVSGHNLSPQEACQVMLQLTEGVSYIHEHGLLHRDLKPDNLFYLPDGSVKITDFGISSKIGEKTSGDAITGTVYYCAPEILMGEPANVASDIYSMGIIFFEILTGTIPFDGATPEDVAIAQIKKHFPEPSKYLASIPKSLDKIIVKACRKRPEERYANAFLMREDILKAFSDKDNFKEKKGLLARLFGFK